MLLVLDENVIIVKEAICKFDKSLWRHCLQTAKLALKVSEGLDVDRQILFTSGLVHDIGKIFISPDIIFKRGSLTKEERAEIDKHSIIGYTYLQSLGFSEKICEVVLLHHGYTKEKYGHKYNEESCRYADILRACDIYDAVTHNRVYHERITQEEAMSIIESQKEGIPDKVIEHLYKAQVVY